jgi:hypothetical protein
MAKTVLFFSNGHSQVTTSGRSAALPSTIPEARTVSCYSQTPMAANSVLALRVPEKEREREKENRKMLWTIFVILMVLWLLGLVTSYTFGGFIHVFLVIALIVLVINLVQGRRVV